MTPKRTLYFAASLFLSVIAPAFAGSQEKADIPAAASNAWNAPDAINPILPGYFADPSFLEDNGAFYIYATIDPWGGDELACWKSTDLKSWTFHRLNWPTKQACTSPTSRGAKVWAPSVIKKADGKFYMYVSVGSEVWVGHAETPLGPWHDAHGGTPLIPGDFRPGYHMIDAECFIDKDGIAYLYWGSGWDWKNGRCFAVKLGADMASFAGDAVDVTPKDGHYFEGPYLIRRGDVYMLMYSDGITMKDTYRVYYATGKAPLGPFVEATSTDNPILESDRSQNIISPGHHAVFEHDGKSYILYHRHRLPYVVDTAFRQICVDELRVTNDGTIKKVTPSHFGPATLKLGRPSGLPIVHSEASSELDSLHSASRAFDDNYATRWSPAANDSAPTLTVDLGSVQQGFRSELRPEYAWKDYHIAIETSADGKAWTTVAADTEPVSGSPIVQYVTHPTRYVRLRFASAKEAPSLIEWTFFPGK
ncbi:MAG TPA: family 43 glycosylhydrolase [Opitutaceae bacterium]|nr:family 43 glycosylhydrolase [Opitutaceae bacterium]